MKPDITNAKQSLMLLKAGVNPLSANMMLQRVDKNTWMTVIDDDHKVTVICRDGKGKKITMNDFPKSDFVKQQQFSTTHGILPALSTGALLDIIPDDQRQTVMITRGGYDSSRYNDTDEDGYVADAHFANFDFEDKENEIFFNKVYGGDSYIEAATKLVVDYLSTICKIIPK